MYTLAENGTNKKGQDKVFVTGEGSDLNKKQALQGRAKRKTITQSMALSLIDIVKENGDSEREKAYWNTYYCQNSVITANGRLYGKYCKNRFCTLCCSIRKAEIINRYLPVIKEWEDPHFVTLTVKSCKHTQLKSYIRSMKATFKRVIDKYKKQDQRGTGTKLIGVKSLECCFNPQRRTYNPHFHLIVANPKMADIIVSEWINRSNKGMVSPKAQYIQKTFDVEKNLIEIIKYGSKIFTEPDLKKHSKSSENDRQMYVAALDTILAAMKGKRIFDRFGFNLPEKAKNNISTTQLLSDFQQWEYNPALANWQNIYNAEVLTDYKLPSDLAAMLSNNVNSYLL